MHQIFNMKIYHTLFFLLAASAFHSQVISGTIISKNENHPIPYVKIGIEKKSIGTISDEKGNFSIDLSNTDPRQKIKIEVPG